MSLPSNHANVLPEIVLELLGEGGLDLTQVRVKLLAGEPHRFFGLLDPVSVHFQLDALFKRVRLFVASKPNMLVG